MKRFRLAGVEASLGFISFKATLRFQTHVFGSKNLPHAAFTDQSKHSVRPQTPNLTISLRWFQKVVFRVLGIHDGLQEAPGGQVRLEEFDHCV